MSKIQGEPSKKRGKFSNRHYILFPDTHFKKKKKKSKIEKTALYVNVKKKKKKTKDFLKTVFLFCTEQPR